MIRFYSEKALRQLGLGLGGLARVRLIGIVDLSRPEALRPYLAYSGFSSIGEWVSEYRRLNEVRLVKALNKPNH